MKATSRTWMYSKDGAQLFSEGETIPSDFVDNPDKIDEKPRRTRKAKDDDEE